LTLPAPCHTSKTSGSRFSRHYSNSNSFLAVQTTHDMQDQFYSLHTKHLPASLTLSLNWLHSSSTKAQDRVYGHETCFIPTPTLFSQNVRGALRYCR